jgi:hypothetical protein
MEVYNMRSEQDWDDWIDGDAPGEEPLRLCEDAPEEIRKHFEEWKKQKAEDEANGIWK